MHKLEELAEMLTTELEEQGRRGDLSERSLEQIDKLAHAAKNVYKLMECMDEMENGGYSNNGGWDHMNSYARGRGANARRDSRGRYSINGYSRAAGDMVEQLKDMMMNAPDNQTRQSIERLIAEIENR